MAALRKPSPTNVRPIGDFCNKICKQRTPTAIWRHLSVGVERKQLLRV
jgi:hypothetical protein